MSGEKLYIGAPRSKRAPAATLLNDNSLLEMLTQSHIVDKDKKIAAACAILKSGR